MTQALDALSERLSEPDLQLKTHKVRSLIQQSRESLGEIHDMVMSQTERFFEDRKEVEMNLPARPSDGTIRSLLAFMNSIRRCPLFVEYIAIADAHEEKLEIEDHFDRAIEIVSLLKAQEEARAQEIAAAAMDQLDAELEWLPTKTTIQAAKNLLYSVSFDMFDVQKEELSSDQYRAMLGPALPALPPRPAGEQTSDVLAYMIALRNSELFHLFLRPHKGTYADYMRAEDILAADRRTKPKLRHYR